jgi:hypothetical protein
VRRKAGVASWRETRLRVNGRIDLTNTAENNTLLKLLNVLEGMIEIEG